MTTVYSAPATPRRATMPLTEPTASAPGAVNPPSVDGGMLYVKAGDIIDVGIAWQQWLRANDGKIATSAWAAHASSPAAPTLGSDGVDQTKGETVVIVDASAAAVGDTYYITNTVTIADATPGVTDTFDLPTRTLKRVLHVKVVL